MQFPFGDKDQRHDDMADDDHGQIRRKIVGANVPQFLRAGTAFVGSLEEFGEQPRLAAARAGLTESAPHQRGKTGNRECRIYDGVHARL